MKTTAPAVTPVQESFLQETSKFINRLLFENVGQFTVDSLKSSNRDTTGYDTNVQISFTQYPGSIRTLKYRRNTPDEIFSDTLETKKMTVGEKEVMAYVVPLAGIETDTAEKLSSPYLFGGIDLQNNKVEVTVVDNTDGVVTVDIVVDETELSLTPGAYRLYFTSATTNKLEEPTTYPLVDQTLTYDETVSSGEVSVKGKLYIPFETQDSLKVTGLEDITVVNEIKVGIVPVDAKLRSVQPDMYSAYIRVTENSIVVKTQDSTVERSIDMPADLSTVSIGYSTNKDLMGEPTVMPDGVLLVMDGATVLHSSPFRHVPQVTLGMVGMVSVWYKEAKPASILTLNDDTYLTDQANSHDFDVPAEQLSNKKFMALADNAMTSLLVDIPALTVNGTPRTRPDGKVYVDIVGDRSSRLRFTHKGYFQRGSSTKRTSVVVDRPELKSIFADGTDVTAGGTVTIPTASGTYDSPAELVVASINLATEQYKLSAFEDVAVVNTSGNNYTVTADSLSPNYVGSITVVLTAV